MTDKMLSRKDGGIGYVIFNNPERHNAVSMEMWAATGDILDQFRNDPDVRVVVLTGAGGKAFVSGADISKFGSRARERGRHREIQRDHRAGLLRRARISEADDRDDPRLLHRRRHGARDLLRHAHRDARIRNSAFRRPSSASATTTRASGG